MKDAFYFFYFFFGSLQPNLSYSFFFHRQVSFRKLHLFWFYLKSFCWTIYSGLDGRQPYINFLISIGQRSSKHWKCITKIIVDSQKKHTYECENNMMKNIYGDTGKMDQRVLSKPNDMNHMTMISNLIVRLKTTFHIVSYQWAYRRLFNLLIENPEANQ